MTNNSYDTSPRYIDQTISGFYIKYIRLNDLILQSYAGSTVTKLNFFIDMGSIVRQLFFTGKYYHRSKYDIVSSVINMCGHYRQFFNNKGVYTRFFIINGLNCPEINTRMVKGYNSHFMKSYTIKKDMRDYLNNNLELLNLLCEYLPMIYFFDGDLCEVSSIIAHLIKVLDLHNNEMANIVLSKDVVPLQLIPVYDVRVLRPVKNSEGDESFIVDKSNLYRMYCLNYRRVSEPTFDPGPYLISNILAMSRIAERSMTNIFPISQLIKIIKTAYSYKFLSPETIYNQSSINEILSSLGVKHNKTDLEFRWKSINPDFQASFILPNEAIHLRRPRLIDLTENDKLKIIIDQYFNLSNNPIDLDRLY